MIPLLEGQVAILFANSVLYGLYLATLPVCLRWLLYNYDGWKRSYQINWFILAMTFAIFVSTTLDTSFAVRRSVLGIRQLIKGPQPDVIWSNTAQSFLSHLQNLIVDAVLTYRCWIIYDKSMLVVVFPTILWMVGVACTIVRAVFQRNQAAHIKVVADVTITFWTSSIALNLYATSLIVYKIVSIARFKNLLTRRILFVMRVIIESGLIYTATSVMVFISSFTKNVFAQYFLSALNFQVTAIAFNLIIIRMTKVAVEKQTPSPLEERLTSVYPSMSGSSALPYSYGQQNGRGGPDLQTIVLE